MKTAKGRIDIDVRIYVNGQEVAEDSIGLELWHQVYQVGRSRLIAKKKLNALSETHGDLLTRAQAAVYLGVPIATIRKYEEVGLLPRSAVVNGRVVFWESVVRRLGMAPINQVAVSLLEEESA